MICDVPHAGTLPGVLHDVLRTRVGNSLSAGLLTLSARRVCQCMCSHFWFETAKTCILQVSVPHRGMTE